MSKVALKGKNSVLAVGSVATDDVETPFGKVEKALGGSAVFFSAAARFFCPVSVVAVVGEDFPKKYRDAIDALGIDHSGIRTMPGKTFHWAGRYGFDLSNAETLKTELNVFQAFKPELSPQNRESRVVFLANIDPEIQMSVLKQVRKPLLTACDTMNYWIGTKKPSLLALLKKVDVFLCNEGEARELSGEYNLIRAASWVLKNGPKLVVIKKGEHGVACFSRNYIFTAPAFILEKVFDPTGAGDSFAGGFIGYLSRSPKLNEAEVRRAVVYGNVMASFNVESFSLDRLRTLKRPEIKKRFGLFRKMTRF